MTNLVAALGEFGGTAPRIVGLLLQGDVTLDYFNQPRLEAESAWRVRRDIGLNEQEHRGLPLKRVQMYSDLVERLNGFDGETISVVMIRSHDDETWMFFASQDFRIVISGFHIYANVISPLDFL